jgi:hypothetical protein
MPFEEWLREEIKGSLSLVFFDILLTDDHLTPPHQ